MAPPRSILRTPRRPLRHSSVPDNPTRTATAARSDLKLITPFANSPELRAPPHALPAATQFPFAHSATGQPNLAAEGFVQRRASSPDPVTSTQRPLPSCASSAMKRSEFTQRFLCAVVRPRGFAPVSDRAGNAPTPPLCRPRYTSKLALSVNARGFTFCSPTLRLLRQQPEKSTKLSHFVNQPRNILSGPGDEILVADSCSRKLDVCRRYG
jgi:hypothetical protein